MMMSDLIDAYVVAQGALDLHCRAHGPCLPDRSSKLHADRDAIEKRLESAVESVGPVLYKGNVYGVIWTGPGHCQRLEVFRGVCRAEMVPVPTS